ncbi:MAG: Dabb family protein [Gemmatimonadota bacterium]
MILHLVLFRFKPDASAARIDAAGRALLGMQVGIPEIRGIQWGPNLGPSASEYPFALQVRLDDMGAVQTYLDHPVHRATVKDFLHEIREARMAIDLEVP